MRILFLGPYNNPIIKCLEAEGHEIFQTEEKINLTPINFDFGISFKYRYKLNKPIIDFFQGKLINLHISYLPYNRGADPNLWSFIDDSPVGVTIHLIDEGIDTGPILIQKEMIFDNKETLQTSYKKLNHELETLFILNNKEILAQEIKPYAQVGKGSYHKTSDKESLKFWTKNFDWNISIHELKNYYL